MIKLYTLDGKSQILCVQIFMRASRANLLAFLAFARATYGLQADIERYNIIDIISYHYITFSRILIKISYIIF
jgi:hypothetical protein